MSKSKRFTLKIQKDCDDQVKVTWRNEIGLEFDPYFLYREPVLEKAIAARKALQEVGNAYRNVHGEYDSTLRDLADAGRTVRDALFSDGPPEYRDRMRNIRDWFESWTRYSETEIVLAVTADPWFQIPWGVLHDRGSENTDETVLYEGFWAPRYNVSVLYNGFKPRPRAGAVPQEKARHLAAVNPVLLREVTNNLDAANAKLIDDLLNRRVGKAFTIEGCRKRWEEVGDNDCVLSFFAHGSGVYIDLDEGDRLSASDFRKIFMRESAIVGSHSFPVSVISFLNGCETSAGEGHNSFLVATADPGFCGYVGVEATIPDRFALLFGQEFLHSLLVGGRSVGETMRQLWDKHRPMALFYGNYADPDFKVEVAASMPVPTGFEMRNLSYELGGGRTT